MKYKIKTIYVIFGTLFVTSVILALILSPLRGSYFNETNFMDKAIVVTGFDNGKIKSARALTNEISQNTGLEIPNNSNSKKKGFSANKMSYSKGIKSTNGNETFLKSQPFKYDLTNGKPINSSSEPTSTSTNQNQDVSSGISFSSGFMAYNTNSNKKSLNTNSSLPGFVSVFTDLSSTQIPLTGAVYNPNGVGGPPPDSGGDDPLPAPPNLPIGNGVNFMLILAIVFGGWKVIKSSF